jgi:hypothetical protein
MKAMNDAGKRPLSLEIQAKSRGKWAEECLEVHLLRKWRAYHSSLNQLGQKTRNRAVAEGGREQGVDLQSLLEWESLKRA